MSGDAVNEPFVYDDVAYPTSITPALAPDRMRAAAMIFGYRPPDCATASVLEIGCGEGWNLFGIAAATPSARCVGFDLSAAAIERGQAMLAITGLANVELHTGDVLTYPRDGERFDYVICHGLYAWAPAVVRDALLALIRARLAPGGIAQVSFDSLPAAAPKAEINGFLVRQTAAIREPRAKVEEAARLIGMLAANQRPDSRLKAQLDNLVEDLPDYDPGYFFHDWLAEHYHPISLRNFAEAASGHGLRLAGDVALTDLFSADCDEAAAEFLSARTGDLVARSEAVDFLRGSQMFRRTLLVREDAPPPAEPDGLATVTYEFIGRSEVGTDERGVFVRYQRGPGCFILARAPEDLAVMQLLAEVSPREFGFDYIKRQTGLAEPDLRRALDRLVTLGILIPHATPQPFVVVPGERPVAEPSIRALLERGDWAITLRHAKLMAEVEATRVFLTLCDGTRTRAELAAAIGPRFNIEVGIGQIEQAIADLGPRRVFVA